MISDLGRRDTAGKNYEFLTVLQSGGHSASSSLAGQHPALYRAPGTQLQMSSHGKGLRGWALSSTTLLVAERLQLLRVVAELQVGTEYCHPHDLVTAGLLHKRGGRTVFSAEVPEVHAYAVISRDSRLLPHLV